jgi:hypothetical protein
MSYQRWIYHAKKEPQIISSDDFAKYAKRGWCDSPAQFIKLESVGIDKAKIDAGDEKETAKAQQVFDAVEGVKESLNGALNLDSMDKSGLEGYAQEHLSLEIDSTKSDTQIRKSINTFLNS